MKDPYRGVIIMHSLYALSQRLQQTQNNWLWMGSEHKAEITSTPLNVCIAKLVSSIPLICMSVTVEWRHDDETWNVLYVRKLFRTECKFREHFKQVLPTWNSLTSIFRSLWESTCACKQHFENGKSFLGHKEAGPSQVMNVIFCGYSSLTYTKLRPNLLRFCSVPYGS